MTSYKDRLQPAIDLITGHLDKYQSDAVAQDISKKVDNSISKSQREFLLRQQLKGIKCVGLPLSACKSLVYTH